VTEARSVPADGLHIVLAESADQVPRARLAVRQWLRSAGLHGHHPAAELLVSELVTNALRHGRPPVELRIRTARGRVLRIEVLDGAVGEDPVPSEAPPDAISGRGLSIVAALAVRWGTEAAASGKVVWAELDPSSR
jgi:anti-sigma regulatory factor (Ser/Thr protein kinase)